MQRTAHSNSNGANKMTFHLFRSLPTEIQDHIWDLAIRPLPGNRHLHEFIIVDHYFDKPNGADKIHADFLRFENGGYLGKNFGLAVPRNEAPRPNTSAYTLDSGLWMACQQSRKALERCFRKNEWWSDLLNPGCPARLAGRGDYAGHPRVSHSASYIDSYGKAHHVTICPGKDLVHLVGLDPGSVEWFYHYAGDRLLFNYRREGLCEPHPSFLGLDVAISFDLRWIEFIPSTLVDMIAVLHDHAGRTLWFIDQRLHRLGASGSGGGLGGNGVSKLCPSANSRERFYSAGYVFTEVREGDAWEVKDQENRTQSVFEFFRRLIPEHNRRLEIEGSDRMRVLACEMNP